MRKKIADTTAARKDDFEKSTRDVSAAKGEAEKAGAAFEKAKKMVEEKCRKIAAIR